MWRWLDAVVYSELSCGFFEEFFVFPGGSRSKGMTFSCVGWVGEGWNQGRESVMGLHEASFPGPPEASANSARNPRLTPKISTHCDYSQTDTSTVMTKASGGW